ncbi:cytochrome c oxidase subunit 3 [Bizionia arctica]|uniref:Cytochrome b6 n=1 Tax=Bizionia arctica TaxID=1495645 RepID=A0A917LPE1_9FLAO|nr:cytochrome c oxidase subunit 3 [Bizionia arctica]GGG49289.1 cytochrome b6 [Bizionia arctica]
MKNKGKLIMLIFIFSETFFFIALIIAYVYYRNFSDTTDTVAKSLDAVRAGIFTLFLIASSGTLILSKKALQKKNYKIFKLFMGLTIVLGSVFTFGQITEYIGLYQKQITLSQDIFGSSFFTLTGFHGLHVILGLIALAILFFLSFGKMKTVTIAGIDGVDVYWHFVDVVWLFVFYFVYITPLL